MNLRELRSDTIYRKMMKADPEEKEKIYREQLMKPFEQKWLCIGMPLKSEQPDGYDVVSASTVSGGYHPRQITQERESEINRISDDSFWKNCKNSIFNTLKEFEAHGIKLPVQDYIYTVMLNDPDNAMASMTGDYCGDGGIPGYIIGTIIPNERSLSMLPVALAHETNHNVRWQFMKWSPNITLADMIVSEGLAESYAAYIYGEDHIGMWVKNTANDTLEKVIKPAIHQNLNMADFQKLSTYLYGDKIMKMRGAAPVGMPYCAGYACGYALIQYYLKKTGKSIYEATIMPTEDILAAIPEFWN